MSAAAPLPRQVLAQARMELILTLRRGESLLIAFGIPLVLLLFFGSVPILPAADQRPVEFLVPGILALAIMSTGMVALGIGTAFERYYGVLKRIGGSPLPPVGLLAGKMAALVLVELLQVGLIVLAARLAFGWQPAARPELALAALLLGTVAFSGLGLLLAGLLRAEATLAAANGLYLLLLLIGDMVVPLSFLPAAVAQIAQLLPSTALAATLRAGLMPDQPFPLPQLVVLLAWAVGAPALAAGTFRWE